MKLIVSLILFFSVLAQAANLPKPYTEISNGGKVVICHDDNNGHSYLFYDIKEWILLPWNGEGLAKDWRSPFAVKEQDTDSHHDILERIFRNLSLIDQYSADRYRAIAKDFLDPSHFYKSDDLPDAFYDTNDGEHWLNSDILKGCHVEQLIVQYGNQQNRPHSYYINEDLWNKLDPLNKAAATLHEVLYHVAIQEGREGAAMKIRFAGRYLFNLDDLSNPLMPSHHKNRIMSSYITSWWQKFDYSYVGWNNYVLRIPSSYSLDLLEQSYQPTFYSNHALKRAYVERADVKVKQIGQVSIHGLTTFYPNGSLKIFRLSPKTARHFKVTIEQQTHNCSRFFNLNERGQITYCE